MRAREVMVSNPHVAVAGATASEVAIMFRNRNVSVVPVVDDHRARRFLGVLSDRDIVTRCLAVGKDPLTTRVDELMREDACIVGPEQELDGFELHMDHDPEDSHLRATITVIDDNQKVVGFISRPEQISNLRILRKRLG
jgi:CBS domain-containing protein